MTSDGDPVPRSNPFSTRYVRPGAIKYLFAPGESTDRLVAGLASRRWRGQIVGPHGSGKSTLLASLARPLEAAARRPWSFAVGARARRLPRGWVRQAKQAGADLIVIDGFEQLSAWGRFAVNFACAWHRWGLLVTTHRDAGFPTVYATAPDLSCVQAIVRRLVGDDQRITPHGVADCFAASKGNVRETLFALYDRWEACHGSSVPSRRIPAQSASDGN